MTQRVAQLLFCPQSGSFSHRRLNALTQRLRSLNYEVRITPCGPERKAVLACDADDFVLMGGDGTIRHALHASLRQGRPRHFLLHPSGTINLLARELAQNRPHIAGKQPCFFAHIEGAPLINCASISPDSMAVARNTVWMKRLTGRISYVAAFLTVLFRWERPRLQLHWLGKTLACEAVYIVKSRYYAGPWSIAPDARASLPELHVIALRRCRRRDYLRFIVSTLLGTTSRADANAVRFRCAALTIESSAVYPTQVDGDIVTRTPVRISIDPEPMFMTLL